MKMRVLAGLLVGWLSWGQAAELLPVPPPAPLPMLETGQVVANHFDSLYDAVAFYLLLEGDPRWHPIADGPLLRLGDRHPQVAELRVLLELYGDLKAAPAADPSLFDRDLQRALRRFQARHGAKVDAILGPETRYQLNVPPARRADQLMVNIRRREALASRAGPRYVQVNLPEFRLRLMDHQAVVLEMKTIIGRRSRRTPVLESQIESLVINPAWNVPRSIAYKDILPRWREDKDYLAKHNLRVVAGWGNGAPEVAASEADFGRFYRGEDFLRFRQPPGDDNALGRIKFVFPNSYAVYMHDTPQQALFAERVRAFSSGCVRVEKPRLLADSLLRWAGEPGMDDRLYRDAETRWIHLNRPIPLYLTYWTAWIDGEQVLHFGEDIYHLDPLHHPLRLGM